jgi:ribonuclease HII
MNLAEDIANKTVVEIKSIIDSFSSIERYELIPVLENDSRTQVRKLAKSIARTRSKEQREFSILAGLLKYERKLHSQGFKHVAGVDEAGRGALAGPLVAAAAILPKEPYLPGLRDSKQLTPEKRDILFDMIKEEALAWNIVAIENTEIDTNGIQTANLKALTLAAQDLNPPADFVLSDAFTLRSLKAPSLALIKGDSKSLSIAAASVLAKVTRDRMMLDYHSTHPNYEFDKHKGYGTSLHMNMIEKHGASSIHRMSFYPCSEFTQAKIRQLEYL